jgi:hypothetical protein
MYKRVWKRLAAALFLSWAVTAPAHADVTVGTPSIGGNCYPFGCGYAGEYQQVYGSSAFSGPININTVEFFFPAGGNPWTDNTGSYTLAFYLTSQPVNGLSTTPASNEAVLLSNFGTFTPGLGYTFVGNSFSYDPALGNLLLDVIASGTPNDSNALSYSYASGDPMSNLYRSGGTGAYTTSTNGLVTRFSTTAVPEPSTWALLLLGFFAIGTVMRSRKSTQGILHQIA